LGRDHASVAGREDYLRVELAERGGALWADPLPGGSAAISNVLYADGLVVVPADREKVAAGEEVEVRLYGEGGSGAPIYCTTGGGITGFQSSWMQLATSKRKNARTFSPSSSPVPQASGPGKRASSGRVRGTTWGSTWAARPHCMSGVAPAGAFTV